MSIEYKPSIDKESKEAGSHFYTKIDIRLLGTTTHLN